MLDLNNLSEHRRYLMRYATAKLRSEQAADELVQETLLAAVESAASFGGKSSVRTWLTAILKHKIIDMQRREARSPIVDVAAHLDEDTDLEDLDALFVPDGHWRDEMPAWGQPEQSFENQKFWEAFEHCLDGLPAKTARAFFLREIHGMETDEICQELDISSSNCWVMLYRARLGLRECLQVNWFGEAP